MSLSPQQRLVSDFVGFLQKNLEAGEIAGDERESIEVAMDCLRESFRVADVPSERDLLKIYEEAPPAETDAKSDSSEPTTEVSEKAKAEGDKLKVEGNKLMAQKKYSDAVKSYTEAIEKNPYNALYYSNRAAARSQLGQGDEAVEDARQATILDPSYSKGWSRLGLALWSTGDLQGSLDAYARGLEAEGPNPSEAMKRDFAMVKRRYMEEIKKREDDELSDSVQNTEATTEATGTKSPWDAGSEPEPNAAGGGGGFPGLGGLADMMKNPQLMKMAQSFMSNPESINRLMSSPGAQKARESMEKGQMPSMADIMQDPNLMGMLRGFMGGQ